MSTNTELYARDFFKWTQTTAELIREGKWYDIDSEALAEEIESLGKSEKRELESRVHQLVMHLLKWRYQPEERPLHGRSWQSSINNQRVELPLLLRDNPSLRPQLPMVLTERYPQARIVASQETKRPLTTFPQSCPWTVEQILDDNFWPED